MTNTSALEQLHEELRMVRGRRGQQRLEQWASQCPVLARAGLRAPADVPDFVAGLEFEDADAVLRTLVEMAQKGDSVAVVTALLCLRWGLCAVAGRESAALEEVISEATLTVLEYPLRRPKVVNGLLLDVRNRLMRRRRRWGRELLIGDSRRRLSGQAAKGELGVDRSAGELILDLVYRAWKARRITRDEARLILETRVLGDTVGRATARRRATPSALYQRRERAERRLAA